MTTSYHSQYWASLLTVKGGGESFDRLSHSIASAKVDLNPHQVDAALFAVRSPLSKGAILADEVGLGKTIEAGIVISQRWAERRRKILLILPATLRKQWQQELLEKFSIPCTILEASSFNQARKEKNPNPFLQKDSVVICSYHFASAKADLVKQVGWDLVVIDEAHRLRNVYKPANKMANNISKSVQHAPKLLLTATPLQNSLMELYGLVSIIDPHVFGDIISFREQFVKGNDEGARNILLKQRLKPICQRTLRKQVLEYIRFTRRIPLTEDFYPSDDEQRLYEQVSNYLQRKDLLALPASQRSLMTLVLRKLLASSTFAIAKTLRSLVKRLKDMQSQSQLLDDEDLDGIDELEDEYSDNSNDESWNVNASLLKEELAELEQYALLAESIQHNAKGEALQRVLTKAFKEAEELQAPHKAVIFTESRRTQQYLFDLLISQGYADKIVLINGSNTDPLSNQIYHRWLEKHKGSPNISGSKSADTKAALVEEFRERATLLIATESAAEGVNLQFCSLVVNYDLPWNPQRVEQRIGRCHRYGQKHDVVVVNFLNRRNAADMRVFQLLSEKFRLFDGVFGASDEVLGAVESGVDIEKRIAQVYQECRTAEDIQQAFDILQAELDEKISAAMMETRKSLLENFDEEVHTRLKVHRDNALASLNQRSQWLLSLTRQELGGEAKFEDDKPRFQYSKTSYNLDWKEAEARDEVFYSSDYQLAKTLITKSLDRKLNTARVQFEYSKHGAIISALQPFVGKSGWLEFGKLTVESLETEEFLVFAARADDDTVLDNDQCHKLLGLSAKVLPDATGQAPDLKKLRLQQVSDCLKAVDNRNGKYFDEEVGKLDRWADDLKFGLEREIKDIDKDIKTARSGASGVVSLTEKLAAQKELKSLESKRNQKRRELYNAQDQIDAQRDSLIGDIEKQLKQKQTFDPLFTIRWTLT